MKRALAGLLLVGCASGLQLMEWPVRCGQTTQAELDDRYRKEVTELVAADGCTGYNEFVSLMDCPQYHAIWRRYWQARRDLAACK